jgi:hypothetical protein
MDDSVVSAARSLDSRLRRVRTGQTPSGLGEMALPDAHEQVPELAGFLEVG